MRAEGEVKIRDYKVHPLDSDSVPYNFSSDKNPLIHNAARALNLPARSNKNYLSLFEGSLATPSRGGSPNESVIPKFDERFSGYFIISGYNVCFVLPKEFPTNIRVRSASTDSDGEGFVTRSMYKTPSRSRRASVGERNIVQFMAAIALSVPLSSKVRTALLIM